MRNRLKSRLGFFSFFGLPAMGLEPGHALAIVDNRRESLFCILLYKFRRLVKLLCRELERINTYLTPRH